MEFPELTRVDSIESIESVGFLVEELNKSVIVDEKEDAPTDQKLAEMRGELAPEPLLLPDSSRFVLFPIKHGDVSPSRQF